MSDWWTQPYHGAKPERDIKGFPRPLYPPDAATYSKQPSSRGPDVIAYKRTICRLGRWGDWDPASWDDGYWNDFAHGIANPKKRKTSGVEGFQWQQHIDATGWLGKNTFNALCYALIPDSPEFMHPGEHAMDAVAVNLINEAWELFQGHEPTPAQGTVREAALALARTQLGYTESPAGSNNNKYAVWYGMFNYQPWCAIFATWCYETNGVGSSPSFLKGSRYSYVPYIVADARERKNGLKTVEEPIPGDLVCYDWSYDGEYDHVGLFEKWTGGYEFQAIEGNTSTSSDSNGGQVMRRVRYMGEQATVFVRVAEP